MDAGFGDPTFLFTSAIVGLVIAIYPFVLLRWMRRRIELRKTLEEIISRGQDIERERPDERV